MVFVCDKALEKLMECLHDQHLFDDWINFRVLQTSCIERHFEALFVGVLK